MDFDLLFPPEDPQKTQQHQGSAKKNNRGLRWGQTYYGPEEWEKSFSEPFRPGKLIRDKDPTD